MKCWANFLTQIVSESSDGIYQNTAPSSLPATPSPDPPINNVDKTSAEYINTSVDRPLSQNSSSSGTSTPSPSPPIAKRPVARQRSSQTRPSQGKDDDHTYQNVPPSALPVPPPKPATGASPLPGSSPIPSPKPRRTVRRPKDQPPSTSPKPKRASTSPPTDKKLPPPPPHKPQKEKSPVELSPTPPPHRSSTPVKPERPPSGDGAYGIVDMSQITDIGPSIHVVDERSGRSTPLDKIERHLEATGQMDVSKSSSIMDTVSDCYCVVWFIRCMYSLDNITVFL